MPANDPAAGTSAGFPEPAAATGDCRPALQALADALPADDSIPATAPEVAARERKARESKRFLLDESEDAADHRSLFETTPERTLRRVDFILRRDLDRWLAGTRRAAAGGIRATRR